MQVSSSGPWHPPALAGAQGNLTGIAGGSCSRQGLASGLQKPCEFWLHSRLQARHIEKHAWRFPVKTKIAALAVVFVLAIASAQAGDPEKEQAIKTIELH